MKRFGVSYCVQPKMMKVEKIKPESMLSLERKCEELRRILQETVFNKKRLCIKEMMFDFVLNEDNNYYLLQIKDFILIEANESNDQSNKINEISRKGLLKMGECEGTICTFANNMQIEKLKKVLWDSNLLGRKYCIKGKYEIKRHLVNSFTNEMISLK